jgi:DNA-binding transcriptional regulator YhcF (GntR family)/predicted kinase
VAVAVRYLYDRHVSYTVDIGTDMAAPRDRLVRTEALHAQIARNIRNQIEAGLLRDGDVLPSTRELAQQWDVSVFTITEAMKALTAEGLVESRSRSKRTVVAPSTQRGHEAIKLSRPQLLLIGGFAGSGKTELGRILARATAWPILDKDTLTRPVVEGALEILGLSPNDRESEPYVNRIRPLEYESLMAAIRENVDCGTSVIATAPFLREFRDSTWVERTTAHFSANGIELTLVWVYCDVPTMFTYLRHRGAARDAAKLANWEQYLEAINAESPPTSPHVVIDNSATSAPLQSQARQLLDKLGRGDRT